MKEEEIVVRDQVYCGANMQPSASSPYPPA